MLVTSAVLFAGGVVVFFGLIPHPQDIGLPDPDADPADAEQAVARSSERPSTSSGKTLNLVFFYLARNLKEVHFLLEPLLGQEEHKPIGFFQAVMLPGVILVRIHI
jgi:hypothetical protein